MAGKPTYEELEQKVKELERESVERKQAEQLLRQREVMLQHIADNLPVMFTYIDANERYLFVNKKFEENFKQSNVIGKTIREVVGQDRYEEIKPEIDAVLAGKAIDFESRGLFEKGDQRYFRRSFRPEIDESEKVKGFFALIYDITEIKLVEKALKGSEEKFRVMVEAASRVGQAITLHQDKDGIEAVCVFANDVVIHVTGYTREELAQVSWLDIVHPRDREAAKERYRMRMQGKVIPDLYEITIVRKDGTEVPIEIASVETEFQGRIALVTLFRDISERNRIKGEQQESEKKYRSIFEDSRDAIYLNTKEGHFIDANQSMLDLFGYTRQEMINMNSIELYFNPDDRSRVLKELDERGFFRDYEINYKKKNGTKMDNLTTVSVRRGDDGSILGYQGIIRDISEKKRLEAQLQQAQKMEAMGTLAGGIAHDFNNLLMGIQGNASLMLLDNDSNHPHYEKLKAIERMVQSGSKLTRQLLGYARKGRYEAKPINLKQFVKEISDTFGRTRKEIMIQREFEENLSAIEADQAQMEQVLLNLFVNAADAMPGGGDLILKAMNATKEDMKGKLYKPRPGNYVQLNVTDTGTGMDKETSERVFDPFFTTKEMGRGTGLGLASVYGIIKAHGGYIDVNSEIGKGTTFSIYLPASEKAVAKQKDFPEDVLKGKETILLVDDEDIIVDVGSKMLKELGYTVLLAGSGKEAIEIYKAKKGEIDMVILDMIMPGVSGGKTYDSIKETNFKVKVLLSSGYSIDGQAEEILERGCNGFIQKPFNLKELSQKLREILDKEKW